MDRIAYGYVVAFLDFHGDTPAQSAHFRRKHTMTGAILIIFVSYGITSRWNEVCDGER